ncbi:glutaredoxin domain-containing protein [Nocardiopsis sp. NRRL B-16309]|uniref:glutaredoxin domain-containing protein n=1 Tax=Nocardiopsis sp. NRRL B-16309 TaxID=1519494 RepID=UPI0006ADF60F|nr:glutaredoxin domain-containing protein [Nocardiopsis sp. NRRL B-16309]KOX16526.1 glutaredoxin [Nocardiopsis sp. NRRL B-16309]
MAESEGGEAVFYWRPGCPFCHVLDAGLRRAGVEVTRVDIWADPRAAAEVRSITGGDETVPTVVVGGSAMVNPSTSQVVAAVREHAPHLLRATEETSGGDRGGSRSWLARLLGG